MRSIDVGTINKNTLLVIRLELTAYAMRYATDIKKDGQMQRKFHWRVHVHGGVNSNHWNNFAILKSTFFILWYPPLCDTWRYNSTINLIGQIVTVPVQEIQHYRSIIPQLCHCYSPVTGLEINCCKLTKWG